MTIIYQYRVATTSLGGFLRLLTIWRGSVYKLMYKEILIFSTMYAAISLTYRVGLSEHQRHMFERLVIHCSSYTNLIPISFVLGFYVSIVVARWWQQFINVPWPDRTLFMTVTYLHGNDERARMFRRTLARYMILGLILICRSISVAVMKRFPTMEHVIDAGFMTKEEVEIWEGVQCKYHKFWVPLTWANNMLVTARREGRIESEWGMRMIIQQLADFRDKCSLLFVYDWITIPLVYTQVVTLAVYTFFAACLVARQYLDPQRGYEGFGYDLYVPVFTLLQFFFYMGWLKVAEQLINPFGEDDDDYDINWLLDRHTAVAMALIDQCYGKHPPLIRDMYWNETVEELPYTEASYASKRPNFLGSTYNIAKPSIEEQRIVNDLGETPTRRSSVSSTVAGSLLSLFSRRHSMTKLHQQPECLIFPKREDRAMSVPNGGPQILGIPGLPGMNLPDLHSSRLDGPNIVTNWSSDSDLTTRATEDPIERRRRAHTDIEGRGDLGREKVRPHRKFSFPMTLGRKREGRTSLLGTETPPPVTFQQANAEPKQTRFLIEPVSGDSGEGMSTARRNSKKMENMFSSIDNTQYTKNVSRPPLLSAIEEQNTVTSLNQLMQQHQQEAEMQDKMDMEGQDDSLASLAEPELFDEEALALLHASQRYRGTAGGQRFHGRPQCMAFPSVLVHESPQPQESSHRMTGWLSDSDLTIQRPAAIEAARLRRQHRRITRPRYQQPSDDYHDNTSSSGSEGYAEEVEEKDRVERKKYSNELIDMNSKKEGNHRVCDYRDSDDCDEQMVAKVGAVSNLRRQGRVSSSSTMEPSGNNRIKNYSWRGQKETAFTEKEPVTVVPQTKVQLPREAKSTDKKMENYSSYQNNPPPPQVPPPQPAQPLQQQQPQQQQPPQQKQQQQKQLQQQQPQQQQQQQQKLRTQEQPKQQPVPQTQRSPVTLKQPSQAQKQQPPSAQNQPSPVQKQPPPATQKQQSQATQKQLPQATQKQLPQATQKQLPQATQKQLPQATQKQLPQATQKQLPQATQKQLPQATQKQLPQATQNQLPQATQKQLHQATQKQLPQATQKQLPQATQKQLPQATQQQLPQATQKQPPQTTQKQPLQQKQTSQHPQQQSLQVKPLPAPLADPAILRRPKQYQPTVHFQPEVVRKDNQAQLASILNRSPSKTPPPPPHAIAVTPTVTQANVNVPLNNKITNLKLESLQLLRKWTISPIVQSTATSLSRVYHLRRSTRTWWRY